MAVEHSLYPVYGVQFHPESVMTPDGKLILKIRHLTQPRVKIHPTRTELRELLHRGPQTPRHPFKKKHLTPNSFT